MKPEGKILETAQDLARALTEDFQHAVNQAAKSNRDFYIALSGGSAPALFFQMLARPLYQNSISWQNVHFFWGDERCVPPEHPESNFCGAFSLSS